MRYLTLVITISLFSALTACATDAEYRFQQNCDRHANLQCARATFDTVDQRLAAIYQQLADTQEDENVKHLAKSQRDWFKFRDSYAEFVSMRESDTQKIQLVLINQKIDSSLARIGEIKKLIKD